MYVRCEFTPFGVIPNLRDGVWNLAEKYGPLDFSDMPKNEGGINLTF